MSSVLTSNARTLLFGQQHQQNVITKTQQQSKQSDTKKNVVNQGKKQSAAAVELELLRTMNKCQLAEINSLKDQLAQMLKMNAVYTRKLEGLEKEMQSKFKSQKSNASNTRTAASRKMATPSQSNAMVRAQPTQRPLINLNEINHGHLNHQNNEDFLALQNHYRFAVIEANTSHQNYNHSPTALFFRKVRNFNRVHDGEEKSKKSPIILRLPAKSTSPTWQYAKGGNPQYSKGVPQYGQTELSNINSSQQTNKSKMPTPSKRPSSATENQKVLPLKQQSNQKSAQQSRPSSNTQSSASSQKPSSASIQKPAVQKAPIQKPIAQRTDVPKSSRPESALSQKQSLNQKPAAKQQQAPVQKAAVQQSTTQKLNSKPTSASSQKQQESSVNKSISQKTNAALTKQEAVRAQSPLNNNNKNSAQKSNTKPNPATPQNQSSIQKPTIQQSSAQKPTSKPVSAASQKQAAPQKPTTQQAPIQKDLSKPTSASSQKQGAAVQKPTTGKTPVQKSISTTAQIPANKDKVNTQPTLSSQPSTRGNSADSSKQAVSPAQKLAMIRKNKENVEAKKESSDGNKGATNEAASKPGNTKQALKPNSAGKTIESAKPKQASKPNSAGKSMEAPKPSSANKKPMDVPKSGKATPSAQKTGSKGGKQSK